MSDELYIELRVTVPVVKSHNLVKGRVIPVTLNLDHKVTGVRGKWVYAGTDPVENVGILSHEGIPVPKPKEVGEIGLGPSTREGSS